MAEDGWEEVPDRRRPWVAVPAVLALVVLGALLARPSPTPSGDLEVTREPVPARTAEDEPGEDEVHGPVAVAVVHALNTASLATRVPPLEIPLEGRRLRSAVSTRGLQRLVIGLESPGGDEADLQVRDSSTLRLVADLGTHPGPLEQLALGPDGEAVVWMTPSEGAAPPLLHRVEFARVFGEPGRAHDAPQHRSVALPDDPAIVLDVRPLRRGRVAVVLAGQQTASLRVLLYDLTAETDQPATDVTVEAVLGDASPALAWHDAWSLLHIPHVHDDGLTTVELQSGLLHRSVQEGRAAPAAVTIERQAALVPDAGTVLVTGAARPRFDPTGGVNPAPVTQLESMLFRVFSGPPELRWSGDLGAGLLLAAAADRAALTMPWREGAGPGATLHIARVDSEGGPVVAGREIDLEGDLRAVELDASRPRLTAVRAVDGATVVSRHGWEDDAGPTVERRFAPGAIVHPSAVVVIEGG
jgi:hypothetical protein